MNNTLRRIIFISLHFTGFVLLFFVVRELEWKSFLANLKEFPFWKYLTGIGVVILVFVFKSLRWQWLNKAFGIHTTWRSTMVFYMSAGFLGVITPGRLGEFAKVYFLNRRYNVDIASATSSVILDRIWDVGVLSLAAGTSAVWLWGDPRLSILSLVAMGILFLISGLVVLAPAVIFKPTLFLIKRFPNLHERGVQVFQLWKKNRWKNFIPSCFYSGFAFFMLAYLPVIFSFGTETSIHYEHGMGAISITNILNFLPVTVAGFGTRELVFTEIWKLCGGTKEMALSVSTAYFMVTYLGTLFMGGIVYLFNLKKLYTPAEIIRLTGN